jgi:hypothetical protein
MTQQRSRRSGAIPFRPALRKRAAGRQTLSNQLEQSGIVQELIDGIEPIVLEQGGFQGGVEEPGLVRSGGDHKRTRVYRVRLARSGATEAGSG